MINFLNLQYFLVLCEEMNFRRAAQKLHIVLKRPYQQTGD